MKILKTIFILVLTVSIGSNFATAQTIKKDKKAAKEAAIKTNVEGQTYTFEATYVLPQRGGGHPLTSDYDVKITKDSVITFLPYFGRAYFDVPYNPTDGGIKFTSTKFDYKVTDKKKGGWEIDIKPSDVKNIQNVMIDISPDGYATLSVRSFNRDFITFNGYLTEPNKKN